MKHAVNRLTAIRNCSGTSRLTLNWNIPQGASFAKLCKILDHIRKEGYIRGYTFRTLNPQSCAAKTNATSTLTFTEGTTKLTKPVEQKQLVILLKYTAVGKSTIRTAYSISTPGRHIHLRVASLWQPHGGTGVQVLTTCKGLRSEKEARLRNLGGKALFGLT